MYAAKKTLGTQVCCLHEQTSSLLYYFYQIYIFYTFHIHNLTYQIWKDMHTWKSPDCLCIFFASNDIHVCKQPSRGSISTKFSKLIALPSTYPSIKKKYDDSQTKALVTPAGKPLLSAIYQVDCFEGFVNQSNIIYLMVHKTSTVGVPNFLTIFIGTTVRGKILEGENFGESLPMKQMARKILANLLEVFSYF